LLGASEAEYKQVVEKPAKEKKTAKDTTAHTFLNHPRYYFL